MVESNMAINEDGVYIPQTYEEIRDELQDKQRILGTKLQVFESTVYQSMSNPIITAIYNIQTLLAEMPILVSNELKMQQTYIKRSDAITSDAIVNEVLKSELVEYCNIFNTSDPIVAQIQLYVYKGDIDYSAVDLQYTADQVAKITPVFVPYVADANVTLSKTYTSPISSVSTIDIIFNIAIAVTTDVAILTVPDMGAGGQAEVLKDNFIALFNQTQGIGVPFDVAFYQRTLFIDGLSSMTYTATVVECDVYQILRLGEVTVNAV
jgi:hypothetical protein